MNATPMAPWWRFRTGVLRRLTDAINAPVNATVRLLFGDDIFISYSRADGAAYAVGLANELVRRGFACRFDQWGTEPGAQLPAFVIRAIKRSAMFVLVASPGAAASESVKREVETFLKTQRVIIPIDIAAALAQASWKDLIVGLALSPESKAVLESGVPSDAVVSRIEKSFTFRRRDQRLRLVAAATTAMVGVIAALGVAASVQTVRKNAEAVRASHRADAQTRIASARELANQAEFLASQQPAEIELATLLATESARRHESVDTQQALGHTLSLMPRLIRALPHGAAQDGDIMQIRFSADGKRVVTCDGFSVFVWDAADGSMIQKVRHEGEGPITGIRSAALSADGKYLITAGVDTTAQIRMVDSSGQAPLRLSHRGSVDDVAFDPRGRYVATASSDGVTLWDPQGQKIKTVASKSPARRLMFSASGRYLAFMSKDKRIDADVQICVIDVDSKQVVARAVHPGGRTIGNYLPAFDFSAGGDMVASGNVDGTVRVWAVPGGREKWRWDGGTGISSVRLSADGKLVSFAYWGAEARVWDIEAKRERAKLVQGGVVLYVEMSPDGRFIATGGSDRTVRIWDTATGREMQRLPHGENPERPGQIVPVIGLSPSGARLATANTDTALLWDIGHAFEVESVAPGRSVAAIALSADGRSVAIAGGNPRRFECDAEVWNLSARTKLTLPHRVYADTVQYSRDGHLLLTTDDDEQIVSGAEDKNFTSIVWDAVRGTEVSRVKRARHIVATAFSPDSELVAIGSADGKVLLWRPRDGAVLKELDYSNPRLIAFSSNSTAVVVAGGDQILRMRTDTFAVTKVPLTAADVDSSQSAVADWLSEDGRILLRSGDFRAGKGRIGAVVDAVTGQELCRTPDSGRRSEVTAMWLSPRGTYLALADPGLRLSIRRAATCAPAGPPIRLTGDDLQAVAFSPDESYVATLTRATVLTGEGRLSVWRVGSAEEVARVLLSADDFGDALVFSADGRVIGVSERKDSPIDYGDTVRLWHWTLDEGRERACARLSRNMSPEEWQRYLGGEPYSATCPGLAVPTVSKDER